MNRYTLTTRWNRHIRLVLVAFVVATTTHRTLAQSPPLPDRGLSDIEKPADLIKTGNLLHFDRSWEGPNMEEWRLLITEVDGNQFKGLARPVAGSLYPAGVQLPVWRSLKGQLEEDQFSFKLRKVQIDGFEVASSMECNSRPGTSNSFSFGSSIQGFSFQTNYVKVWKVTHLTDSQLAEVVSQNDEAIAGAKQKWEEIKPEFVRLREKGHHLSLDGFLENGEVALSWDPQILGTERGEYNRRDKFKDLSIVEDLAVLPYIHSIYLEDVTSISDLRPLKKLTHIGTLRFYYYDGKGISELADGPQIDELSFVSLSHAGLAELAKFKSIKSLSLNFTSDVEKTGDASALKEIATLPDLEELQLIRVPGEDPMGLVYLRKAKKLKRLVYQGETNAECLTAIREYPALEQLAFHGVDPECYKLIENPHLERLMIAYSWRPDQSDLKGWDLHSIVRLDLPFWVPQDDAEHVRRLQNMDPREYAVYQAIGTIGEIKEAIRRGYSLREQLTIYGGMALNDTRIEEKDAVYVQIRDSLQEIEDSRANGKREIPKIALAVQRMAATLAKEEVMPRANALEVQAKTFVYTGKWEEELKKYFTDSDIDTLEKSHQAYLAGQ